MHYGNELHHYMHVYIMKGLTKEKIDLLLDELHKLGTFPEDEPKTDMDLPFTIGTAFTTVTALKRWVSTAKQNLNHDMAVGIEDAGMVRGTKRLMSWPFVDRGFK